MNVSRFGLAIALGLLAASPCVADGAWRSFRGPHGNGEATDLPPGDGALALKLAWKRALGSGYSGISVADGALVTAAACGDRDCVVSLDPATGAERWRYDLAPAYRGHDGSHDGPIATPAIAGGRVFALAPAGRLTAIDLATGEALWSVHLVDDLGSEAPFYGFGSSPLVVGDAVVVQVGGKAGSVAAFDAATGEVRWRAVEDEIATESPVLAEVAGRPQVLVLGVVHAAGLDPATGEALWSFEHEGGPGISYFSSPLPLGNDRILLQNSRDKLAILGVRTEGDRLVPSLAGTTRGMMNSYSPPARAGSLVFGYTARFLSAVDPASGEVLWRSREPGDGFLIAVGDRLVVLTKTGSLCLGAADPEGWEEAQRLELFDDLAWTPPSYADGAIYARSLGEIARVDLVRGQHPAMVAEAPEPPAELAALAARAAAGNAGEVVDAFLEGRSLPWVNGRQVVFLWRGEAQDVAVAGDMIGMRTEEPMHRLEGTDLWWWSTELDPHARISYLFYVDDVPTIDPSHDRTTMSTVLGADRNWNRGEPLPMSWFAMPEWPGLVRSAAASPAAHGPGGRLETFDLDVRPPASDEGEEPEPVTASIQIWLPPGYDESSDRYPVVYLRDAEALRSGGWKETLDRVVGKTVVPLIAVFAELPRMPDSDDVFVEQVVPAVDERYRTQTARDRRALVGAGWDGPGAAIIVFGHPDLFGVLGIQSLYALESYMGELRESVGDATAASLPLRIYYEWGRWDLISPYENMNMREWGRAGWDLLRERGWEPVGGEVWDSTDWGSWSNRTEVMLEALFPMEGVVADVGPWKTGAP